MTFESWAVEVARLLDCRVEQLTDENAKQSYGDMPRALYEHGESPSLAAKFFEGEHCYHGRCNHEEHQP